MDYKVLITDSAIDDLRAIVSFIAKDDPAAAANFGNRLIDQALTLEYLPNRFPLHDARSGIRMMPIRSYLIYFLVDETKKAVSVLHFWHGSRLAPEG